MQNNYELIYNSRPNIQDIKQIQNCIFLRTQFPKTIPNNTYIKSEEYLSYDLVKEILALKALNKPFSICATSGRWEGTPFMLQTNDNFEITLEDEIFIQNYINKLKIVYEEGN